MNDRVVIVLLAMLVGCARSGGARVPRDEVVSHPATRDELNLLYRCRAGEDGGDYRLGPGDVVRVDVLGWAAMSGLDLRVSPKGTVTLPMIGEMPAADRSEAQLRAEIERRLRAGYVREPHVNVSVVRYLGRQVSVTGAVPRPGVYSLTTSRRTLYDVLSEAGGLSDQAGGRILFTPASGAACLDGAPGVARSGSGPLEFSLTSDVPPGGVNPLEIPLVAGDSVVVRRGRFLVDGWVANPGLYTVGAGMTALDAASIAGGTLFPADLRHVEVVRSQPDGSKKILSVDLSRVARGDAKDLALNEGDVVRFDASPIRMVPYSVYLVFKNLFNVGAGVYVPNT